MRFVMTDQLGDLVRWFVLAIRTELSDSPEYVLHLPVSVALRLPGLTTGVIESWVTEAGGVAQFRGGLYAGWEVVAWPDATVAEKVTASPLHEAGERGVLPVYVLDLLTGEMTRF